MRFLETNPSLSPSIFFFSLIMGESSPVIFYAIQVTEENNQQVIWHHFPVWIPHKGCGIFLIYVNLWSSLLSQPLLHHFKETKEIKGINYPLKQAPFFGAEVFSEEIKNTIATRAQIAALDSNGFITVIKASSWLHNYAIMHLSKAHYHNGHIHSFCNISTAPFGHYQ